MSYQGRSFPTKNAVFSELLLEGLLCDAVLKVDDVDFPIHKVILCDCSDYFQALFTRWSSQEKRLFQISDLSPDMMQIIIHFAYTNSVTVTADNVQELAMTANQFNVTGIFQACCDFLMENICPENCIGIWKFTNVVFFPKLQQKAVRCILADFREVVYNDEFQELSAQELADFLERDELHAKRESNVYEAVLHWVGHRPEERTCHMALLLSKVRLALTSMEYIVQNVIGNKLVSNNAQCRQIAKEAFQISSLMITNRPSVSAFANPAARPRLPDSILLAAGGWSGGAPTSAIEAYDFRADRWISLAETQEHPRAYLGIAFLDGSVYCVGGFDRVEYFNSVRRLHLETYTWHDASPMFHRRCYVSVTVLDGCIYAMGGYDGEHRLQSAERYRPETNQWSQIASMQVPRSDASSTTLHSKVYICGGFNGIECLQSCESYDTGANQWTTIASMGSQRSGVGVIAYANQVFAVGGFNGVVRLSSAEAYNPRTNRWRDVSSMITTRSNFGIEVIDDHLFVVGGYNGSSISYNVECYDVNTDSWSEAADMDMYRSALSCCVVSGLPNLAEYAVPRDSLPVLGLDDDEVD